MKTFSDSEQKAKVAEFACDYLIENNLLHSNMKLGLGTGSTACKVVERIASYITSNRLSNIIVASTSFQTTLLCESLNIPCYSLNSKNIDGELDFTIDGADEIDQQLNLTKGGGAALLLEKILAYNSKSYFIVATENKLVETLGKTFPLPIEIIPEARTSIIKKLSSMGGTSVLREGVKKMGPVVTDNGNFIIDTTFTTTINAESFEDKIKLIPGVVEVGLFTKLKPTVFLCGETGECRTIKL